jgi:hypothetical protein
VSDVPWDEIDAEIVAALHALADYEIDTFGSCRGGGGRHACLMPEILFHGDDSVGLYAVWLLERQGFGVWELSRHWDLDHGLPRRPFWRVALANLEPMGPRAGTRRAALDAYQEASNEIYYMTEAGE